MSIRGKKMDMTLESLLDVFISTKRTEGKSPKTLSWYEGMIKAFLRWGQTDKKLRDLTLVNVRAFIADLQGRKTIRRDRRS